MANTDELFDLIKQQDVKMVDLRFTDLLGTWHHFTVPATILTKQDLENGLAFDGSSLRAWKSINESDMNLIPDLSTAKIDPFSKAKTLMIIGDISDPVTKQPYDRDPRQIAKKAEAYLRSTGLADTCYFGPEAEFFVFNSVKYNSTPHSSFYVIDSDEAIWNSGADEQGGNKGYKIRHKEGYVPCPPSDQFQDLRDEMCLVMQELGLKVERHHHEVATAGQAEIDVRFNSLTLMADDLMLYKYIVKNVARQNGYTATFMPKPLFGDNGNGMHCHQSLWKNEQNLFAGNGYANLSEMALYYIGGLLKHARSLTAFTNPTINSYKRLVPHYEAPVNLAYSQRNRSASIRIPVGLTSPKAVRLEFRCPDPSCNPYVGFAAMMMAGLDGIQNKIHPGAPLESNIYELSPDEAEKIAKTPFNLQDSLGCLQDDHEFLLKGNVFTRDLIETWINYKIENEVMPLETRPNPLEFLMYFDV